MSSQRPSTRQTSVTKVSSQKGSTTKGHSQKVSTKKAPTKKAPSKKVAPRKAPARAILMPLGAPAKRIKATLIVAAMVMSVVVGRALQVQAFDSQAYATKAAERMTTSREIVANRGTIVDRNGTVLAETSPAVRVIADAYMIHYNGANPDNMGRKQLEKAAAAPDAIAAILVKYLGGKTEDYLPKLTAKDSKGNYSRYQVVARKVPSDTYTKMSKELNEGGWYGITRESDPIREYPAGTVASNIIGFVNGDGKGASGLEYSLDSKLKGTPGRETYENSAYGRIPLGTNVLTPAVDGHSYSLTIDSDLQWMTEKLVGQKVEEAKAASGVGIVMDVKSGEILSMANYPSFDANDPGKADPANLGNRAIGAAYEPGSVQKVLTMSALVDMGLVSPDTKVKVPGQILSGGSFVRDAWPHGTINLTARGIIANSSNIGTVMLARQAPKAKLAGYLKSFGLGQPTGVGLPGEASGQVPAPDMPDYTRDQIAFGQGLSVTALQEAAAVAAVANGGVYNPPKLIESETDGEGNPVPIPVKEPHRVVSESTSTQVLDMMESVIASDQYVKDRAIPGYRMAGKSGTAERYDPKTGRYNGYTASFVAVAPVDDPRLLVYVVIDRPTKGNAGSTLALPVVRELMQVALPRYGVPPMSKVPKYTGATSF